MGHTCAPACMDAHMLACWPVVVCCMLVCLRARMHAREHATDGREREEHIIEEKRREEKQDRERSEKRRDEKRVYEKRRAIPLISTHGGACGIPL